MVFVQSAYNRSREGATYQWTIAMVASLLRSGAYCAGVVIRRSDFFKRISVCLNALLIT